MQQFCAHLSRSTTTGCNTGHKIYMDYYMPYVSLSPASTTSACLWPALHVLMVQASCYAVLWLFPQLHGLQAVALGAAVQAGILEGQVSDVMVLDVWQASLMRAFAQQRLRQHQQLAAEGGLDPDQLEDSSDDEVSRHATRIVAGSIQPCFSCCSETAVKVSHMTWVWSASVGLLQCHVLGCLQTSRAALKLLLCFPGMSTQV